ncbi:hypothetical protein GCM10029964_116000 [Kibdelosporangium lantanae]
MLVECEQLDKGFSHVHGGRWRRRHGPPQSIFDSMNNFADLAASGGFEVSAEGGQALIDAITDFQDWAQGQTAKVDHLAQNRKLGAATAPK